jgi:hypothetical protein
MATTVIDGRMAMVINSSNGNAINGAMAKDSATAMVMEGVIRNSNDSNWWRNCDATATTSMDSGLATAMGGLTAMAMEGATATAMDSMTAMQWKQWQWQWQWAVQQ